MNLVYIPIWLYSNLNNGTVEEVFVYRFTFQYGYIQMANKPHTRPVYSLFTFQYGYIQMIRELLFCFAFFCLHSNMVIFKWKTVSPQVYLQQCLHSNMVIFKFCVTMGGWSVWLVYIPIWLYSNDVQNMSITKSSSLHSNMVI